jgi:hypothetical protein
MVVGGGLIKFDRPAPAEVCAFCGITTTDAEPSDGTKYVCRDTQPCIDRARKACGLPPKPAPAPDALTELRHAHDAATARADALAALLKEARGAVGPFLRLLAKSYEIVMPSLRGLFALSKRRHRVEAVIARIDAELGEANTPASSLVEKRRSFLEASMAVMKDARSGGGNNLYINTVNDGLLDAQDKAYDELIAEMKRMGIPTP